MSDVTPDVGATADHLRGGGLKVSKSTPGSVVVGGNAGDEVQVQTDDMDPTSDPIPATNETGQSLASGRRVFVTHLTDNRVIVSGLVGGGAFPLGTYRDSAFNIAGAGEVLAIGGTISGTLYPAWAAQCSALGFPYGGTLAAPGIPDMRGRSTIGQGTGAGLTNRVAGNDYGQQGIMAHSHTIGEGGFTPGSTNSNISGGAIGTYIRGGASPLVVGTTGSGTDNLHPVKAVYVFVQVA